MSPREAAQVAFVIANRDRLSLAMIAKCESGVADAVNWFTQNIRRFFAPEADGGVETISKSQLRRYIAWMRTAR